MPPSPGPIAPVSPRSAGHRRRRGRLLPRLLLAGFSALVTLGTVEAFLSYSLSHPHLLVKPDGSAGRLLHIARFYYMNRERQIPQLVDDCIRYDDELTYTLRLNAGCTIVSREYEVEYLGNRVGLRDEDAALDRPQVVVLGDSFAMGWGVSAAQSFPKVLQRTLGVPVLNAGMTSYGTAREMMLLERLRLPDFPVLLIQYCYNDVQENDEYVNGQGHLAITSEADYRSEMKAEASRRGYFPFKRLVDLVRIAQRSLPGERPPQRGTRRDEARAFLEVLRYHEPLLAGKHVIVFELNASNRNDGLFVREVASQLADPRYDGLRPRVRAVDVSTTLTNADYYVLDDHLTPDGHVRLAQRLAEAVREAADRISRIE